MTNDQQQVEDWRKQFESLFDDNLLQRGNHGEYINDHRNSMWNGFCLAKRNQPVIELPDYIMCNDQKWIEPSEMMDAITAAGYSYKVKE